jgi:hypothetical protein
MERPQVKPQLTASFLGVSVLKLGSLCCSAQLPLLIVSSAIFGLHYVTHVSAILMDPAGKGIASKDIDMIRKVALIEGSVLV